MTTLYLLDLSHTKTLSDACLTHLQGLPRLTTLDMSHCSITAGCVAYLLDGFPSLTDFSVYETNLTKDDFGAIPHIRVSVNRQH